jgi:hypothetical protein
VALAKELAEEDPAVAQRLQAALHGTSELESLPVAAD